MVALGTPSPLLAVNNPQRSSAQAVTTLRPTAEEKEAGHFISQYLLQNHYRKLSVNDSLSQQIFNRFIENLDGSKTYFLASDIEQLRKKYGNTIDDEFLAGSATAGFDIYNLFLRRAKEKIRYMKAAADTMHLNFSAPETLDIDRKSDPWPANFQQLTDLWKKELKYQWLNLKYSGESNKGNSWLLSMTV